MAPAWASGRGVRVGGVRALVLLLVLWVAGGAVRAQTFPTRPVRIVVPFGAGGIADLTARSVAQKLGESLGQPVLVENRPGAGGVAAGDVVAKAEPDGHTLLLMSNGTAVTAGLFKSLPFDTLRDFAPVSTLGSFDIAIITAAESRFRTLAELLAFGRANPGRLNIASVNIGSTQNLVAELLKSTSGVDMQIVPFNATPAVIAALRGGQIDAAVEILGPVMGQVQGKALRVLAVTGSSRSPVLADVPTAVESGLAGLVATSWNALAAPARTPRAVIARLNQGIVIALQQPELRGKLRDLHVQAHSSSPEQAADLLASDIKRWSDVIQRAKIPLQ
jgi:tripartite-type tricarboxylate transporter receptor subunit TctC